MSNPRLYHHIGIAVGAIALIVVLAIAFGGGENKSNKKKTSFEADRVAADVTSQAFLIRNKIYECYTAGYDNTDLPDKYPASSGAGTPVEMLECPSYNSGVQNLWVGQSPAGLPPPPKDFDKWYYVNAGLVGGRCLRIQPLASSADIQNGLSQVVAALPSEEALYNSSGPQRLIVWITLPAGSPSLDCSL